MAKIKQSKEELLKQAKKYKTFTQLLKNNRKLYYTLHNNGILHEATAHLKRRNNRFTINLLDIKQLLTPIVKGGTTFKDFLKNNASTYVTLKRNGIDVKELFENLDDREYIKGVIRHLMDKNEERVIS